MWLITRVAWCELTAVISLTVPSGSRGSVKVVWLWESAFVSRFPRDLAVFGVRLASQTKTRATQGQTQGVFRVGISLTPGVLLFFSEWLLFTFMRIYISKQRKLQCVWTARSPRLCEDARGLMLGLGRLITASKWRALDSRVAPLKCLRVDLHHRLNSWSSVQSLVILRHKPSPLALIYVRHLLLFETQRSCRFN